MRKKMYKYSAAQIVADWRNREVQRGYAVGIAKKHKVPVAVVHNVIYQHRKKKRAIDLNYRTKTMRKAIVFQSHVVYAGAAFTTEK